MSVRVNLLKDKEYRRQGAVSTAFAIRAGLFSVVAFGTLFGAILFMRWQIARRDLQAAREIWALREPLYAQVQSMKQDLALMKKLSQELRGWSAARLSWEEMLGEIARLIPPSVQLRRMWVRGEGGILMSGSTAVVGGVGDVEPGAPKRAPPRGMPWRRYVITLEGKASGDTAEDAVFGLVKALGTSAKLKPLLEMVDLKNLQREAAVEGTVPDWRFTIEAKMMRLEIKEPAAAEKDKPAAGSRT